ncbi:MAG: NAD(P)H-dependent oxidoreductase [Spirochaetes bacterium]|jgi:multimeric flavodoxin WrbA|nr:NAD(P)H-dependent oxidoreductase [Spirochaetota bacterium]
MRITVLCGSPKGELSVTLQYVNFIRKKFPEHEFGVHHIGQSIKRIEKDASLFGMIIDEVRGSEAVLWAVPLYVLLVPSQCKRFIELVWERGGEGAFAGKYAGVITTSIHFFDHTAHNYLRAVSEDLGMKFAGAYSPDMFDIMKESERARLLAFAGEMLKAIESRRPVTREFAPLVIGDFSYTPAPAPASVDVSGKKVLVLADGAVTGNLGAMVGRLSGSFAGEVDVVDIAGLDIRGGCLGCIKCGFDYHCAYEKADGYIDFYNDTVKTADIIVFCGEIRDRYLSARWKQFFDRAFFNTHTPTLMGKQMAFVLSGPLRQIPNLREILSAFTEWQQANLVDIITDEDADSATIDALLSGLAARLIGSALLGYIKPVGFLGVGGMKIFRDDIWGRLHFAFQADHRFYEANGLYDFPQDDERAIAMNKTMFELTSKPEMKEEIRKTMRENLVAPMRHIVETR